MEPTTFVLASLILEFSEGRQVPCIMAIVPGVSILLQLRALWADNPSECPMVVSGSTYLFEARGYDENIFMYSRLERALHEQVILSIRPYTKDSRTTFEGI